MFMKRCVQVMPNPQTPKSKKRLNLDLTPEAYELLQKLSDESGKNMAEVLRTGLALYGIAQEEKDRGNSLAIVEKDTNKVVSKIVTT
jgi:hypothetical protein